ncbi:MAG TPA: pyruvate dehydrogenase complex E1 component subunit beta [Terriglobales bacterium]|nr:pyruvate dehydrogenase complex E1 component subunit beta [Terriglobales bacterium]
MAVTKTESAEAKKKSQGPRIISYAEAGVEALREEMRTNSSIVYMGQGIGPRGGNFQQSRGLFAEFGADRVRDTPIAERGQTGLGIGAALTGTHPVVDIVFLDFVLEAICEIIQQASTIHYISDGAFKVPVVIRAAGGGVRSTGPHHSHTFYSFFMHIPGLKVALPSTPYDVKGLMKTALRDENPVIFIEHKGIYNTTGEVPEEEYLIPFGKAVVRREGEHVTLVALSAMVHKALAAAAKLEEQGISVEVIDPRTLAPFDKDTILTSVAKTGRLVILDEAYAACGVSAEIAAIVAGEALYDLDAPIHRICCMPAPHAFAPSLDNYLIPSVDRVVSEIAGLFGKKL